MAGAESANLAVVRKGFEGLVAGDIEAVVERSTPDVELVPLLTAISGEPYRGHDGLRAWHRELLEVFAGLQNGIDRMTAEGDYVFAEGEIVAVGRGNTPTIRQRVCWLVEMRDGKAARIEVLASAAEARRRAGFDQ